MMNTNQKYFTKAQKLTELISYLILIAAFAVSLYFTIRCSGQEVPVHFNAAGEANRYGSAGALLIMPIVMLFCEIMISLIAHCMPANLWNMPFKVNPGNEIPVFHSIIWMVIILDLILSAYTLYTAFLFTTGGALIAVGTTVMVIGVFADIIWFCVRAWRCNRM